MKKYLRSIAKSMKTFEKCQARSLMKWESSLSIQKQNLSINTEVLAHSRESNRITMNRFVIDYKPVLFVLEGLLQLVAVERVTDVKSQEIVDEARRIINLMRLK